MAKGVESIFPIENVLVDCSPAKWSYTELSYE